MLIYNSIINRSQGWRAKGICWRCKGQWDVIIFLILSKYLHAFIISSEKWIMLRKCHWDPVLSYTISNLAATLGPLLDHISSTSANPHWGKKRLIISLMPTWKQIMEGMWCWRRGGVWQMRRHIKVASRCKLHPQTHLDPHAKWNHSRILKPWGFFKDCPFLHQRYKWLCYYNPQLRS